MKYKNIFWGVFFIFLGIFWLLKVFSVISFHWCDVLKLWPLIFIWIGISLLQIKDWIKLLLNILTLLIGLVILFYSPHFYINSNIGCSEKQRSFIYKEIVSVPLDSAQAERATLIANVGACEFMMTTSNELLLVKGDKETEIEIDNTLIDNHPNIELDIDAYKVNNAHKFYKIGLNTFPIWDIELNIGATKTELNFAPFKIENLEINAGVSDISVKIGDLYPSVTLDFSVGVSNILLQIPENMDCMLIKSSALSSYSLDDFEKDDDGIYVSKALTPQSVGTIKVEMGDGVSNINVERYPILQFNEAETETPL